MRSLERRFNHIKNSQPFWSDYQCFCRAIAKQKFGEQTIHRWFNKLVDKNEYSPRDKRCIIAHLEKLNKSAEGN
ncbi:hypothetical protein GYA54_02220 [Candidatus Kuenenbacteria bacterium]|nr:hypothetical protein [Candidatus Kuenenbacteria bacterium]